MSEVEATVESEFVPEPCARRGCCEPATEYRKATGYCVFHYRVELIRQLARQRGKHVPSEGDVKRLISESGMVCRDCGQGMVWTRKESTKRVMSLQHYRDGTMAMVCQSCNIKHAHMPGDIYRDISRDQKWCPGCKATIPVSKFRMLGSYGGRKILRSRCMECTKTYKREYRQRHARIVEEAKP